MGYGYGNWAHATQFGLLLYDMPGCGIGIPECAFDTIGTEDEEGILKHLCAKGVSASGKLFMCAPEQYSYTHLSNPFPCAEVLVAASYLTLNIPTPKDLPPFMPWEDLDSCVVSYTASIDAYYDTYLASDMDKFTTTAFDLVGT